jgi:hypothetical protein
VGTRQAIPKRKRGGSDSESEAAGQNDGLAEVADEGEGVEGPSSAKVAKTTPPTEAQASAAEAPSEQAE